MTCSRGALIALCFATTLPAGAGDDMLVTAHWELGFGGKALTTSGGLALGMRGAEYLSPIASHLLKLDVNEHGSIATIAGVPITAHTFQATQSADEAYEAGVAQKPFYAKPWFLWTMGGIAATAALLTSFSGSGGESESHTLQVQDNGSTVPINGDSEGGYQVCGPEPVRDVCGSTPGSGP